MEYLQKRLPLTAICNPGISFGGSMNPRKQVFYIL